MDKYLPIIAVILVFMFGFVSGQYQANHKERKREIKIAEGIICSDKLFYIENGKQIEMEKIGEYFTVELNFSE